ncbi:hypothetical protein QTH87_20230 [Variovorax sp. J22P168]|uniref:hypothetical protein n=1 Tax=Variovorax jilinensis TaxID=3053513 RepID=UPI0025759EAB|nr:hypothetical protein [Variovorax sp. J22P168]MDM0014783.1 hypothetical protein [Variovorax sp. J22P168]
MSNYETDPYRGRAISPDGPPVERAREQDTVQLTDLSARAISLFQKQSELTDKLWAYFGTYSGMAMLAALGAPILAQNGLLPSNSTFYLITLFSLATLAYFVFAYSNRESLNVAQEALGRMAAQATVASGIPFAVVKTPRAMAFHKCISWIILCTLVVGFWSAVSPAARVMALQSPAAGSVVLVPATVAMPAPAAPAAPPALAPVR